LALAACSSESGISEHACSGVGAALSVCAAGATVKGVDVSTYQGVVDWAKVKASGHVFGIARISDGTAHPDDQFARNWPAMKAAGVVRGAYQFFRPGGDPAAQADLVASALSAAGGLAHDDLPVVMDMEVTDGQSAATIQANMHTWLTKVEQATGKKPIIYTGAFMSSSLGTGFAGYPLWVANWGVSCPTMPANWTSWKFWQDADNGSVSGISGAVDTDVFNGSLAQLTAYAGGTQPAPDAGSAPHDAGAGAHDAGSGAGDAGSGEGDAGASGGDAGSTMGGGGSPSGDAGGARASPCGS
jgi:lysozyme